MAINDNTAHSAAPNIEHHDSQIFAQYQLPDRSTHEAQHNRSTEPAPAATPRDGQHDLQMTPIDTAGWKTDSSGSGPPELSQSQSDILNAADAGKGEQLWNKSRFAKLTNDGAMGGAVAVSEVLKQAGMLGIDSPSILGLEAQLKNGAFEPKQLSEAKPGDVVVLDGPGGQRIGIVGKDNTYYSNVVRDNKGVWVQSKIPEGAKGRVYSPPGTCGE